MKVHSLIQGFWSLWELQVELQGVGSGLLSGLESAGQGGAYHFAQRGHRLHKHASSRTMKCETPRLRVLIKYRNPFKGYNFRSPLINPLPLIIQLPMNLQAEILNQPETLNPVGPSKNPKPYRSQARRKQSLGPLPAKSRRCQSLLVHHGASPCGISDLRCRLGCGV